MKKEIGGPAAIALVVGAAAVILLGGYFLFFRPEKPVPYEEQQAKMQKLFDKEAPKYLQKFGNGQTPPPAQPTGDTGSPMPPAAK